MAAASLYLDLAFLSHLIVYGLAICVLFGLSGLYVMSFSLRISSLF